MPPIVANVVIEDFAALRRTVRVAAKSFDVRAESAAAPRA